MSIASLTDARLQRVANPDRRTVRVAARHTDRQTAAQTAATRTITPLPQATDLARYIPSEAIAIYVAVLALFSPLTPSSGGHVWQLDFRSRWWLFGLSLVFTAALTWLIYLGKRRQAGTRGPGRDLPIFELSVAVVAMAVWACALPDSPLLDFEFWDTKDASVLLLVATALIPVVANALGKTPPTYEEAATDA